ncbi:recombinase family protein [Luteolibacter yonseiensis]|uniref:Recombinase family protein n=1 Tax=Luteolibacter yonseiensis TaxID=1144680 RepID=A0A934R468_9BACT|nr:recombinase family protein [Luteolibacter yonseiensis]MBK1815728.1 recombinase family protein [Luteolibacter yonseiensis]
MNTRNQKSKKQELPVVEGPKRAYSYIRFSSKKQAKGSSLSRQLEKTRKYCRERGLLLDESMSYQDLGVSAWKGMNLDDRNGLGQLVAACQDGLIPPGSAIVVEAMDRISRQRPRRVSTLLGRFLDEFRVEIHLIGIEKVLLPDVPTAAEEGMDLMYIAMLASRAAEEQETKSDRLKAAFERKRRKVADGTKLMETKPGKMPWWIVYNGKSLESPPDRAEVVRSIYLWTADGVTAPEIARRLQASGIPTWRPVTKIWTSARVRDLVRSRAPEGILSETPKTAVSGLTYEVPGYYPKLVDADIAERARAAMTANRRQAGRPHEIRAEGERPINILRGLLRYEGHWCAHGTRANGTDGAMNGYFIVYLEELKKTLVSIPARLIEPTLLAGLVELKPADLVPPPDEVDPYVGKLASLKEELKKVEKVLESLADKVEQNPDIDTLLVRLREREADRKQLREEIGELSVKVKTRPSGTARETKELKSLIDADMRENAVRGRIAELLRSMIERIDFSYNPTAATGAVSLSLLQKQGLFIPDPLPASKRRKALSMIIHFRRGGRRAIVRLDPEKMAKIGRPDTLFSGRC